VHKKGTQENGDVYKDWGEERGTRNWGSKKKSHTKLKKEMVKGITT